MQNRATRAPLLGLKACLAIGIVMWWSIAARGDGNVVRDEDICGPQNGRRLYLELGEKGILHGRNVTFAKNEPRQEGSRIYAGNSSHAQCSLELVTCPSCVIVVTFRSVALSHHCGDGSVTMDSPCRCDYVWISEPPYEDVSGTPFCGLYAPITYRSSTRTLSITLLYSESHRHAFTLEYTAERNRLQLTGTKVTATGEAAKGSKNSTGGGILASPFFPARYPRDLGLEYVVTCPADAPSCRVRLLFSDFQLATVSIMEFYDWNGQRLDVSSGARFRPPVIMSSGPSLLIRFYANGGTGLGYKAFYSFVVGQQADKSSVQPITDCGGYVENLGGTITMLDMVGAGAKTYDCVWLIRPPKSFLHTKTHMYLKVVTFADMAGNTELVVKQGPTSALPPLEILRHPASQVQPPRQREHVAPVTSGFHVSLRGTFGPSSRLAVAYAAFSYTDCFAGSDFLCRNHRCVPSQLSCDGFDHCGDNSDEPASCFQDWESEPRDRKWRGNKANYYFPKIDRYPDLKTATLVFVASSIGLIILISALIVLLYRMGARARQQRELQSRLQTISELLAFDIADGARIDEISVADEPPSYEAPPGYDEVVKPGLESRLVDRKKRRTLGRTSPGQSSVDVGQPPSVCTITERCSASTSGRVGRATPTPIHASKPARKRSGRFPASPPPPYVTPPGSILRKFGGCEPATASSAREERGDGDDADDADDPRQEGGERGPEEEAADRFSATSASSFSFDAEFFGAYPRNRDASSSIRSVDLSCNSQRRISRGASIDAKPDCDDPGDEDGATDGALEVPLDAAEPAGFAEADGKTIAGCCCEGACGCATVPRFPPIPIPRVPAKREEEEEEEEDESRRSPGAIFQLFGSRTSTATSTPCATLRRSVRRFSACQRDACLGRTATVASVGSYETLSNLEWLDSVSADPRRRKRACCRRYSSCDLERLQAGIRCLDEYLARQAATAVGRRSRGQSVTVMVFGTPEHGTIRRRAPARFSACSSDAEEVLAD